MTGAALRMTWPHFLVTVLYTDVVQKTQNAWYKAVSAALNFPFLKEVSQNCFVLDVVNFQIFRK